jgi:hypothetical protein
MRIAILSIFFLVGTQGLVLASNLQTGADSFGAPQQHEQPKKPMYSKGKGVFGLITGLVLGPVGYVAVCIFSHNRTTRKKALLGMEIWIGIAVLTAIVILIVYSGNFKFSGSGSGGRGSTSSGPNINYSGYFGTGEPVTPKVKQNEIISALPSMVLP